MSKEIAIYVHVPFCIRKCNYCDFVSYSQKEELIEKYFECLNKEIEIAAEDCDCTVSSIFIGGGTPSLVLQKYITETINSIRNNFSVSQNCEISIETNPGTLNKSKLGDYFNAGINRISIGAQAMQDKHLKTLGRIHGVKQFEDGFLLARQAGFSNINVDLIFGIPGQSVDDWKKTLERIVTMNPEHISCYSLKIEDNTVFAEIYKNEDDDRNGFPVLPPEDEEREMYHFAIEFLKSKGYRHYEISNFCKPGYECRHNLAYWKCKHYFGFGAGAHSYCKDLRFCNKPVLEDYIKEVSLGILPRIEQERLDEKDKIAEFAIMGLRLIDGIDENEFQANFGYTLKEIYNEQIKKTVKSGLLKSLEGRICLTDLGLDFANQVMIEFLFSS